MSLREKLKDIQKPLEIRCLEDRIQQWEKTKYGLLVYPKKKSFDRLVVSSRGIGGFEVAHVFLSIIEIVLQGKTTEKEKNLYQVLKGYECELYMGGILRREAKFKSTQVLQSVLELHPNPELAMVLNADEAVMRMVKVTKPDELRILLFSPFEPYKQSSREMSETSFCEDPRSMSWACLLTKYVAKGRSFKKNICEIYDLLDMIAGVVLKFTEELSTKHMD